MRTWRLLGHYDAVTTTYSACAGALQTSPYTPDFNGTLIGLRAIVMGGAATSLVQHVQFRLSSTTFTPNVVHVGGQGAGIQTAPAVSMGPVLDWQIIQPVRSGVPIDIEGRNNAGAATPVTVNVALYGLFEVGK